jgi:hypothetical protein
MGDIVPTQSQTSIGAAGIAAMEAYVAAGDIGKLQPRERVALYRAVCESLGLNPLTQPFQYLPYNGKLTLYATKSCTEQLRMIHGVSVVGLDAAERGDCYVVTARVRSRDGREDIATGAVRMGKGGDDLANSLMKAETKAKRRATLSICGLAMLDETEIETIPGARPADLEVIHGEPVEAMAEPAPAKAGGKARNPAPAPSEVAALLDPTPAKPAAPAPTAPASLPSEIVVTREHSLTQVREGLWRLGCQVGGRDVAILDDRIGSALEASQAFGVAVRVALAPRAGGGMRVSEILGDVEEVRI